LLVLLPMESVYWPFCSLRQKVDNSNFD
jgi:hypothetical protein